MSYTIDGFSKTFVYIGRASRKHFFAYVFSLLFVLSMLTYTKLFGSFAIIIAFGLYTSIAVRRLHDLGKKGTLVLYHSISFFLLFVPSIFYVPTWTKGITSLLFLIIFAIFTLILTFKFCRQGQAFDNEYGEVPKSLNYNLDLAVIIVSFCIIAFGGNFLKYGESFPEEKLIQLREKMNLLIEDACYNLKEVQSESECENEYSTMFSHLYPYSILFQTDYRKATKISGLYSVSSTRKYGENGIKLQFRIPDGSTERISQKSNYIFFGFKLYLPYMTPVSKWEGKVTDELTKSHEEKAANKLMRLFQEEKAELGEIRSQDETESMLLKAVSQIKTISLGVGAGSYKSHQITMKAQNAEMILVEKNYKNTGLFEYKFFNRKYDIFDSYVYMPSKQLGDPLYIECPYKRSSIRSDKVTKAMHKNCTLYSQYTPFINYRFQLPQYSVANYQQINQKALTYIKAITVNWQELENLEYRPRRFIDEEGRILKNVRTWRNLTEEDFIPENK